MVFFAFTVDSGNILSPGKVPFLITVSTILPIFLDTWQFYLNYYLQFLQNSQVPKSVFWNCVQGTTWKISKEQIEHG